MQVVRTVNGRHHAVTDREAAGLRRRIDAWEESKAAIPRYTVGDNWCQTSPGSLKGFTDELARKGFVVTKVGDGRNSQGRNIAGSGFVSHDDARWAELGTEGSMAAYYENPPNLKGRPWWEGRDDILNTDFRAYTARLQDGMTSFEVTR